MGDYFTTESFMFTKTKEKRIIFAPEVVAYCADLESLIDHVLEKCNVTDHHLKFGMDGGGGFLKVCLSIQATTVNLADEKKHRQTYQEVFVRKNSKILV